MLLREHPDYQRQQSAGRPAGVGGEGALTELEVDIAERRQTAQQDHQSTQDQGRESQRHHGHVGDSDSHRELAQDLSHEPTDDAGQEDHDCDRKSQTRARDDRPIGLQDDGRTNPTRGEGRQKTENQGD